MKRFITFTLLFTALHATLFGKEQYIYTQISQNKGLTSTINCIYKEPYKDVWLGANNGLYRFNGYDLTHYEDTLFKGRQVFQTSADKEGNIWILTDKWLVRKTADKEEFVKITPKGMESGLAYYSLCHDDRGIYFGCDNKIMRYDYETDSLYVFCEYTEEDDFAFKHIKRIGRGRLLCGSHNGIVLIESGVSNTTPKATRHSTKEVSSILVDSKQRVWIAFYNDGIEAYKKDGTLFKSYTRNDSDLTNDIVLCMTEKGSQIWAGTNGGGINIIDPESDKITNLSHISGDASTLPALSIKSLHVDHSGNVWAGSIRKGLIRISRSGMKTFKDVHIGMKHGLSNPTVLNLYQDSKDNYIWIGTDGEGINRLNPATNSFTHYKSTLKTKVVSIAGFSQNELVLSLYADGLYLFDKESGDIRPLDIHDENYSHRIKYTDRSVNLINEHNGDLLLLDNTIHRFDKSPGTTTRITNPYRKSADGNYLPVGISHDGVWIHDNHNLYLLPTGANRLLLISSEACDTIIRCAHMNKDGVIWLATDGGLSRFNANRKTFENIDAPHISQATSIVCDNSGRVWIGTHDHLYAYISKSGSFALFGESDGAAPNEFLARPRLLAANGDVYMGGVQGLLHISNDLTILPSEEPVIEAFDINVDGETIFPGKDGRYIIPRGSHNITINATVLVKDIFRKKMFRFESSDGTIRATTNRPLLKINQIPAPGTYNIYASCSKRNGDWSAPTKLITFVVPQHWALSWWFLLSVSLLWIGGFYILELSRRQRKKSHNILVAKEQEQRIYEEKVQLLINISHELRTPLTLIMAPLKRLLKNIDPQDANHPTLSRIYRQSKRMKNLLNMVLDLRKMEEGQNKLNLEPTMLNLWLKESIEDLVSEEQAENISIITDFDPQIGSICFDRQKFDIILMNIMINAIKHSSTGDRITLRTRLSDDESKVRISISDEGPGLGNVDLSRLFNRFYQSNSEKYGSGIGLAYSKILVDLHKGKIGAYSNEIKGATFWWEIPVIAGEQSVDTPAKAYLNEILVDNRPAEHTAEKDEFNTFPLTLMLVDDSQDLLDFMKEALQSEFSNIITKTGGKAAMKAITSGKAPDIIVSDINMPDGDGYSLCKELKAHEKYNHIPIILLTAQGEEKSQGESYRVGAEGFVAKPFEIETLMEIMRGILKRKSEIKKRYLDKSEHAKEQFGSSDEGFILRFNQIISKNLSNPALDQQMICSELGVSRALLYNKMRAITGAGAKEYITRIRIEKAKSLIETTTLPIVDIAEMTGFTSQSYFSTAFKAQTGMTPSQYKRSLQETV